MRAKPTRRRDARRTEADAGRRRLTTTTGRGGEQATSAGTCAEGELTELGWNLNGASRDARAREAAI